MNRSVLDAAMVTTMPTVMAANTEPPGGTVVNRSSALSHFTPAEKFAHISESIIIPAILAMGVITNCFSLLILPRADIARTFRTCLVALTLSDLCAGTIGLVQMGVEVGVFGGNMPWGRWDPWAVTSFTLYFVTSWFMATSSAIVIAIVAMRHYTISQPISARLNVTPRVAQHVCLGLLAGTLLLFLPTTLNVLWQSCHKEQEVEVCVQVNKAIPGLGNIALTYLLGVTILYGPVLVLVYIGCMVGIRLNLRHSDHMLAALQESGGVERVSRQRTAGRITRTLLLILILDAICCSPLVVQAIAMVIAPHETVFSTTNHAYHVFDAVAEIMLVLRPAYNFWLYAFSHKSFRLRVRTLACCLCMPKYKALWNVTSTRPNHQGRHGRLSSATSTRMRSVDLTTDATLVTLTEQRESADSGSWNCVKLCDLAQDSDWENTPLNGKANKVELSLTKWERDNLDAAVTHNTKL